MFLCDKHMEIFRSPLRCHDFIGKTIAPCHRMLPEDSETEMEFSRLKVKGLIGVGTLERREGSKFGLSGNLVCEAGLVTASADMQGPLEPKRCIGVVCRLYMSTSINHWI